MDAMRFERPKESSGLLGTDRPFVLQFKCGGDRAGKRYGESQQISDAEKCLSNGESSHQLDNGWMGMGY